MLHVEVRIPAIAVDYEFSLNEHVKIALLIEEIAFIVAQKQQKKWDRNYSELILCDCSSQHMLPMEKSLYQCKVKPGSTLMLL